MKNKTTVYAALGLLFIAPLSHARWGTDFNASSYKMEGKDLLTTRATLIKWSARTGNSVGGYTDGVEENNVGGSAGFFMEGNSLVRLGLSAGYGVMPVVFSQHRLTYASGYKNTELDTKTTYVPVDLYLKLGTEGGGASFFLGGGGDFVTSISEYRVNNTNGTDYQEKATFTQKKMIPHAQAGG